MAEIINDTIDGGYDGMWTGFRTRAGQRLNAFPIATITSVVFYLRKSGSPTGTAYARVRKVSDDSLLGTIGSIDVSGLITSFAWITFNTTPLSITSVQDIRIVIEYTGGSSGNSIRCAYCAQFVCKGELTTYDYENWVDGLYGNPADRNIKLYYTEVAYPTDAITRVTGLVHRYSPGNYSLEIFLGDTKTDWSSSIPQISAKPTATLETPIPKTTIIPATSVAPALTEPFATKPPTATQMAQYAGMGQTEYNKIIRQNAIQKALKEFGPISGPADLQKFITKYPALGIGQGIPKLGTPEYLAWALGQKKK